MPGACFLLTAALLGRSPAPLFEERAAEAGLDHEAKRVAWADIDGDGWPDAVLDRRHVFWNRPGDGPGGRTFVAAGPGIWSPPPPDDERGFTLFADADGDGDIDALWAVYLDLERPRLEDGEVVRDEDGRPVPVEDDPGWRTTLYRNDGDGSLVAAPETGLASPPATTTAGAFLDYDADGNLDLFLGNWYREYGLSYRAYSDRLYRGLGGGRFLDVTREAGVETLDEVATPRAARPTYGVSHCDVDGDGDQDILTATYGRQANFLWRNDGDGTFTEVGRATGLDGDDRRDGDYPCIDREAEETFRSHGNTFDIACGDWDADGDGDLLLGEITHWWGGPASDLTSLLIHEEGGFRRENAAVGLVRPHLDLWRWNQGDIHVGWIDADLDGRLDAFVASGDYPDGQYLRLWLQEEPGRLREATRRAGLDWEGSGGVSLADFDRDGDADLLIGRSLFRLSADKREELGPEAGLWVSLAADGGGRWIGFLAEGTGPPGPNRAGIGTRIRIVACGAAQYREILTGRGHAGHADAPEALFGLGACRARVAVEVRWPDSEGTVDRYEGLRPRRWYLLRPGMEPRPLRYHR